MPGLYNDEGLCYLCGVPKDQAHKGRFIYDTELGEVICSKHGLTIELFDPEPTTPWLTYHCRVCDARSSHWTRRPE